MSWDPRQLRNALGQFTTGVCIVSGIGAADRAIGMTINSFSSVSLNPSLVQWSLKNDSLTFELFSDLPRYSISILADSQLEISRRYAVAGDHTMMPDDVHYSESGLPIVRNALAHFECRKWQSYKAGDHHILIGSVEKFSTGERGEPLVFFKGNYRTLVDASV